MSLWAFYLTKARNEIEVGGFILSLTAFDLVFVISAVIFHLSIVGVFITQRKKNDKLTRWFGFVTISLAIPVAIVFINYFLNDKPLWVLLIFVFIFLYLFLELLLDVILKIEFRKKLKTHVPYIILFYITSFGFIGISFNIDTISGYIVTITFWAVLASLIYLYWGRKKDLIKN